MRIILLPMFLVTTVISPSTRACELDGLGIVSEADFLASLDLTGLNYEQQLAARDAALATFRRDQQALIDKVREDFKARFKVPPRMALVTAN